MTADLYETIGVERSATDADIKRAFRRRAKKVHPDTGGSAEAFAGLNRAYLVLIDPERRETYDRTGKVEDKPVDNGHVEALTIVQQMMDQIVEQAGDRIEIDIVEHMRAAMDARVREIKADVKTRQRGVEKLRRLASKFHKEGGENILRKMVEAKIGLAEHAIASADKVLANLAKARALLDGYRFDVDPVQQPAYVFMRTGRASASSTATFS